MNVFFSDKMVADSGAFSPSAGKPALAVKSWLDLGLPIDVVAPEPVTVEQLCLAHDAKFVRDVLKLRRPNGFGNRRGDVARSLPYTSGAMLAAARDAIANHSFSCAPVSGFHHAGWDHPGGYCTFNGLMVTALALLGEGVVKRVGILDCDQHYGDGTDDIIHRLGVSDYVMHYTYGRRRHIAERFLDDLPAIVHRFASCDVLLYQAGADPHIDDPLGGNMTTEQLRERDSIVFEMARVFCIPVGWCLAGGYQRDKNGTIRPVLEIHDNTMKECLAYAK